MTSIRGAQIQSTPPNASCPAWKPMRAMSPACVHRPPRSDPRSRSSWVAKDEDAGSCFGNDQQGNEETKVG